MAAQVAAAAGVGEAGRDTPEMVRLVSSRLRWLDQAELAQRQSLPGLTGCASAMLVVVRRAALPMVV